MIRKRTTTRPERKPTPAHASTASADDTKPFSPVFAWNQLVITSEKIFLVRGISRRRASAVMLRSVQTVGLDQSLAGRAFGYGTLVAGPLQVSQHFLAGARPPGRRRA